ncbi:MAG: response regulator transcription factor [Clostridiales bacterium]|nr:response regulator transcription factor [Clostridiales bacterium]
MFTIMIVEDDPTIAKLLASGLRRWGYGAFVCDALDDVAGVFAREQPHMVLMDCTLPYYNGYHWCEEIRKVSKAPIVFISSNTGSMDMVMAMSMGGDDYIAKPFDMDVVVAKIGALLRRAYDFAGAQVPLSHRGAALDAGQSVLIRDGRKLDLTRNECRILQTLLEHKGTIVGRDTLMQRLWDSDCFIDDNTLTVNIARLRRKLDEFGLAEFIATRKGQGYLVEDA